MEKNIRSENEYYIKAKVENNRCPLDWLVQYYREYNGKLVSLDKNLMDFLLNKCKYNEIQSTPYDGFKQTFTIIWHATEQYPETRVVVSVYGRDPIEYWEGEGYVVDSEYNYYIIEELKAEDILVNNQQYAEKALEDKQMILLVGDKVEKEYNDLIEGDI